MTDDKITHVTIGESDFKNSIEIYEKWKDMNDLIKTHFSYKRKVNIPEAFTEVVCCYVNGFNLAIKGGSEDAVCEKGRLIQVKASANWSSDLTSFGPTSEFDELHFIRLKQDEEKLYLYNIPLEELYNTKVNKSETFKEQQDNKRRPRFSIIKNYIQKDNIEPYAIVDLKTKKICKN